MKLKEALDLVLRMADAHANGALDAKRIHQAISMIRAEMKKGRNLHQSDLFNLK